MIRDRLPIVSPYAAPPPAPAAPPAGPQPPVDTPPEFVIEPPPPPGPTSGIWRKVALPLVLGVSVAGMAVPIVQGIMQSHGISQSMEAVAQSARNVQPAPGPPHILPVPQITLAEGAQLSPDGRYIVGTSGSYDPSLIVVRASDGRPTVQLEKTRGVFVDGRLVTWRTDGKTLSLRDPASGRVISTVDVPAVPTGASVSPTGGHLTWTEERGNTLHTVAVTSTQLSYRSVPLETAARIASWSQDGRRVTLLYGQNSYYDRVPGRVYVVDVPSGQVVHQKQYRQPINNAHLSPDGTLLALGDGLYGNRWDGRVMLVNVQNGETIWEQRGFGHMRFVNGATVLMAGGSDGQRVFAAADVATGTAQWTSYTSPGRDFILAMAADGSRFATSTGYGIQLFDMATGQPQWGARTYGTFGLQFSPDGRTLAMTYLHSNDYGGYATSVLAADDGRTIATQNGESRNSIPSYSTDGQRLLMQNKVGYHGVQSSVVDLTRSPMTPQEVAAQQAAARQSLGALLDEVPPALRERIYERIGSIRPDVLRSLDEAGVRIVVGTPDVPTARAINAEAMRQIIHNAFREADRRHAERMADNRRYDEAALVQYRKVEAYSIISAESGTQIEPLAARGGEYDPRLASGTADTMTTPNRIAAAHGATTAAEREYFVSLMVQLNGPRLEQAQERYLEYIRTVYPEAGLAPLPIEQRPFRPGDADLVVPSIYLHEGRWVSGRDHAVLQAGSGVYRDAEGRIRIVLNESMLNGQDDGAVRRLVGAGWLRVLQQKEPQLYNELWGRWQSIWWNSRGDNRNLRASELFAQKMAQWLGPNRARLEADEPETSRIIQNIMEAASATPAAPGTARPTQR